MNKKGQSELVAPKTIFWTIMGMLITAVFIVFVFIVVSYQNNLTQVPPTVEAELISLRFINNPDCFAYQDPLTKRIYPGTIDSSKFNQDQLDSCYRTDENVGTKDFNFGLALNGLNTEESLLMTNNFFNDVDFTLYFPVIIKIGSEETAAELLVQVQEKI